MGRHRQLEHTEVRAIGPHVVQFANGSQAKTPTLDVRFLAWLIDTIIVIALAICVQLLFWANPPESLAGFRDFAPLERFISFILFFFAIYILYDSVLHRLCKGTLGKLAAGASLVSVESGERVTWRQSAGRALLRLPMSVTVLGDPDNRGFHDYWARTVVVCRD